MCDLSKCYKLYCSHGMNPNVPISVSGQTSTVGSAPNTPKTGSTTPGSDCGKWSFSIIFYYGRC